MGSNIEDYRVINRILETVLTTDVKRGVYKNICEFENEINGFLNTGYTLHGPTLINGTSYYDLNLTQVVIKYSNANKNNIKHYKLVLGVFSRQLNIPWARDRHDPCTPEGDSLSRQQFEETIRNDIRNGWSLYGDIHYHKQGCGSSTKTHVPPHFIQVLVKYRTVLLTPL
jgi:hypothetical protein